MIKIKKVRDSQGLETIFSIRKVVFVEEQNCPPELEWEHEEESTHFLAFIDSVPAGAARWRQTEKGYKLERFSVLAEFRGRGVGQALVKAVLLDLPSDAGEIYLNSQISAIDFYKRFGFEKVGEQFEEAGIQHYAMVFKV